MSPAAVFVSKTATVDGHQRRWSARMLLASLLRDLFWRWEAPLQRELVAQHWGKARGGDEGPSWHPLVYHSLDVAAVMLRLLEGDPARMAPLLVARAGCAEAIMSGLVAAAALHDLGKFSPGFQRKAPHVPPGAARLTVAADDQGHDVLGCHLWQIRGQALVPQWADDASDRLSRWTAAACCHHGRGRPSAKRTVAQDAVARALFSPEDDAAIAAFVSFVFDLPETEHWTGLSAPPDDRTDELWVTGLVTIADWLGSNQERWFPYHEPSHSAADYWPQAKRRAEEAVFDAGLVTAPRRVSLSLREALCIDDEPKPTPLQSWASGVVLPDEPCLAVIEDLTGAGKTEAASILASRMVVSGRASGVYWAMPTMATANAIYARTAPLASTIYGEGSSATLMTGGRHLNDVFRRARDAGAGRALSGSGTIPAEIVCADWLARDGRLGFLAPVGAGTIDQALLSVLPSRHFPVRLAGLGSRVVVVDEAHAYDAYTGALLEVLLEAHARAGGSAIILSATLTSALHGQLIKAWRRGRSSDAVAPCPRALPCATFVTAEEDVSESCEGSDGRGARRDLPVDWLRSPDEAIRFLLDAARRGAACIWVRNTVDDALVAAEQLREAEFPITLFHARFTAGDRARIESDLLARYGPQGSGRQGGIVIATQVAEQSLDVDFDAMVTDLAPYDSLIQRAGRLHRHARPRPGGFEGPRFHVLSPAPSDDASGVWYGDMFPRAAYVYERHGRLWRTAKRVELDSGLPLASGGPRDLLDWVYGSHEGTPEALREFDLRVEEGTQRAERGIARQGAIDLKSGYAGDAFFPEERAVTRLGEETVPVLLARIDGGQIVPWCGGNDWRGWAASEIGVRLSRAGEGVVPVGLEEAVAAFDRQPWQRLWILDDEGRGRVEGPTATGLFTVYYASDYGLLYQNRK